MVVVPKKVPRRNRRKPGKRYRRMLRARLRRILNRIANRPGPERERPMITAADIHYELGERVQGLAAGGIGAMLLFAQSHSFLHPFSARLRPRLIELR